MESLLEQNRVYVDRHLETLLANGRPQLATLHASVRHTVFAGGKRIRPLLCFLAGELFDLPRERLVRTACALEMIHAASLIIDDLPSMDDAARRRGVAANHQIYGQDVAMLAGIGLLPRAFQVVLADPDLDGARKTAVVDCLAATAGFEGMVGGQFTDLHLEKSGDPEAALVFCHQRKTAALFAAATVTAAIVGRGRQAEIEALETFGLEVGSCFQILDDIADHKAGRGRAEPSNYATVHGVEQARSLARTGLDRATGALSLFEGRNGKLLDFARLLDPEH
jgi:geranylgeranyl diphosphate synthase type II